MSTMQRMTLIGLYNYEHDFNRDLFSSLTLPAGYDKPTFINSLLLEHGEKCVLYTNPDFFKSAIGIWSGKWALELGRIYEALTAEYNPIYNYDRFEESVDGRKKDYKSQVNAGGKTSTETTAGGQTSTETNAGAKTSEETNASASRDEQSNAGHRAIDSPDHKTVNETNTNASTEHEVSADNSGTYQPEWKETQNGGKSTQTTNGRTQDLQETSISKTLGQDASNSKTDGQEVSNSKTIGQDSSNTKTDGQEVRNTNIADEENEANEHKAHLYGNIGITTAASMVNEIVDQRINKNLYDIATRLFANELLIGIY